MGVARARKAAADRSKAHTSPHEHSYIVVSTCTATLSGYVSLFGVSEFAIGSHLRSKEFRDISNNSRKPAQAAGTMLASLGVALGAHLCTENYFSRLSKEGNILTRK